MRKEDCKIARQVAGWNPHGKRRHDRPVNTWKNGTRDSMQRRNLKDEECLDCELWRKKIMSGLTMYSHKTPIYTHTPLPRTIPELVSFKQASHK
jgi:hypothetical protein